MANMGLKIVASLAVVLLCFACEGNAEKAEALFVFGDSYADTGNHNPYNATDNAPWRRPYGFNWPGYPAGRYSSGKVQTDRWAEILGLPTPIAYEMLRTHQYEEIPKKIVHGVNFAVGGSGILADYGYITISDQVKQFKKLINQTGVFGSEELGRSIVLISNAGNDYLSYIDSNGKNIMGLVSLVSPVVSGMMEVVKELYECGFRNFVVSNVAALGCMPEANRTSCESSYEDFIQRHNMLLNESVIKLRYDLEGSSIIIPNLTSASNYIFSNALDYGFEDWFQSCCAGEGDAQCAEVDDRGDALFKMCEDPNKSFYWDNRHPTNKGWHSIMSLYAYGSANEGKELSFVEGAFSLTEWVKSIGFDAYNISPIETDNLVKYSYVGGVSS
ncbi:GDSL esterase/lipase At5g03600 [Cryptomeria japonica]|uniref:GDSL esterase/lipase At5g03600 n=1 Tax=Cryptomeria japonica TaxID=3369 RepID=UPI0027DA8F9D|nr:GDSL esterase/lipase At5g03600 [Cryptomeria japonica]